ncbi:hypothetical protein FQN53_000316 [Emmonsiellopsis sp. PD_33]|nr:hypothetical protein FQN53_000316 [Emmonsiellopsis sp. PD_33]
MDPFVGAGGVPAPVDDPFVQLRDLPQLNSHLRIPPLRDPIPSRTLKAPSPLEPNAGGGREHSISKSSLISGNPPAELPTLEYFLNAARTDSLPQSFSGKASNSDPPPKTILPTFINLRAIEKFPYASFDEDAPRKRPRFDVNGDMFSEHLQLPIPKNQKETPNPPPFGPLTILNGLNEPPPNAALFPPIEPSATPTILTRPTRDTPGPLAGTSGSANKERRGRRINDIIEPIIEPSVEEVDEPVPDNEEELAAPEGSSSTQQTEEGRKDSAIPKPQHGRSRKKLRKWTDQETTDLLRGVVKCGVGNWTTILAQPELSFNDRTAANLKDRFRVCCPWAYGSDQKTMEVVKKTLAQARTGSDANLSGKIVLPDPRTVTSGPESNTTSSTRLSKSANQNTKTSSLPPESRSTVSAPGGDPSTSPATKSKSQTTQTPTAKKSPTLSSKSRSTLVSLGLPEPCLTIKSSRRSRRPFTPAEDEALLKGYAAHGFQWTLIRQDKQLNLMHRKATDLRDRFRTKFPDAYREGGSAMAKPTEAPEKEDRGTIIPTAAAAATLLADFGAAGTPPTSAPAQAPNPKTPAATKQTRFTTPDAGPVQSRRRTSQSPFNDLGSSSLPDPITLPPPPAPGLPDLTSIMNLPMFPFSMDDGGTGGVDGVDMRWEDNTLPPLVWDELP